MGAAAAAAPLQTGWRATSLRKLRLFFPWKCGECWVFEQRDATVRPQQMNHKLYDVTNSLVFPSEVSTLGGNAFSLTERHNHVHKLRTPSPEQLFLLFERCKTFLCTFPMYISFVLVRNKCGNEFLGFEFFCFILLPVETNDGMWFDSRLQLIDSRFCLRQKPFTFEVEMVYCAFIIVGKKKYFMRNLECLDH